jgi:hypothetical protein
MSRAASQVARNRPTITNPAVLMLNRDTRPQKPVVRLSPWISCGSRLRTSMAPTTKQIPTDSPVTARL